MLCLGLSLAMLAEGSGGWTKTPPIALQNGDLVFRRGHGFWTRHFVNCSTREKRFSHVGVIHCLSNRFEIIHSEADDYSGVGSVKRSDWASFFKDSSEMCVFRYRGERAVRDRIAGEAQNLLGVPFDPFFDMGETNSLYCTEMVRIAVNKAVQKELIGHSAVFGRKVIAIDDVYRADFDRIFDTKSVPTPRR